MTTSWHCIFEGVCYNGVPLKQSIPILHCFQHLYILTMVNHVVKGYQKLVSVFSHDIKDLRGMLEPYPDILAFNIIAYNSLPLYFSKDEWFTMRDHVITMIMTMVNYIFVVLWLHSWP